MPISYHIHTDRNLVVTRYRGVVSDTEFVNAYREIYNSPSARPGLKELVDLRDVTSVQTGARAMREVTSMVHAFHGDAVELMRTAVLASTDLEYGLSRMYQAIASETPEQVEVFRIAEEALDWLGEGDSDLEDLHGDGSD
ncbi:MAG: hypothetical protein OES25_17000 [Acidobacteriota bacterium]|nr:hypothetical protein [Acidobacteriota bacterium]